MSLAGATVPRRKTEFLDSKHIMSTEQANTNSAAGGDSASTDHAAAAAQSMSDGLLATVAPPLDQMKSRLTELQ